MAWHFTTKSGGIWEFLSSFSGVGMFAGIDENQAIIPILVILALAAGLILVNKY
jgi:hypothetical protein